VGASATPPAAKENGQDDKRQGGATADARRHALHKTREAAWLPLSKPPIRLGRKLLSKPASRSLVSGQSHGRSRSQRGPTLGPRPSKGHGAIPPPLRARARRRRPARQRRARGAVGIVDGVVVPRARRNRRRP
jgi:hypothetical protein